jgi:transcriptional regulator with XRE-family HTH domain
LEDLEISNTDLARRIHVKDAAISRYRSGSRAPSPDRLVEICLATGLSADEILGLDVNRDWPSHEAARARKFLGSVGEAAREMMPERDVGGRRR